MSTLNFANNTQAALFVNELRGQISDGFWENARPFGHYKPWGECTVQVDPNNVGVDFHADKNNYNFNSGELLNYVGDRMLVVARLAQVMPYQDIQLVTNLFTDNGVYQGIPKYIANNESDFYIKLCADLQAIVNDEVKLTLIQQAIANESYTMKHMRKELRAMKDIARTRQQVTA